MVLVGAFVASLALGIARGGRLGNLAQLQVRYSWLPLGMFLLQSILVLFPVSESQSLLGMGRLVVFGSYAALIAFLYFNRSLPGAKLILLGAALNLVVIVANGGYMPVSPEALQTAGHEDLVVTRGDRAFVLGSKDVVLEQSQTRLLPLSDVLVIPEEAPLSGSFSIGDVAIGLGAFVLVNQAVLGKAANGGARVRPRRRRSEVPEGTTEERSHV